MNPGEESPRKRIDIIRDLVKEGVLGPEDYSIDWNCDRWPILLPDLLPQEIQERCLVQDGYLVWGED